MEATDMEDTDWDETSPKSKLSYYIDFYLAHGPEEMNRVMKTIINTDYGDLLVHKSRKCYVPMCDSCMAYDIKRYIEMFSHMQYRFGFYTEKELEEFYEKVKFFAEKRLSDCVTDNWDTVVNKKSEP